MAVLALLAVFVIFAVYHYAAYTFSYAKFKGDWAVVTGASAGIGAGMARGLARRGINVVLIARSEEKLTAVADECRAAGVNTKVLTFDFANAADDAWASLQNELHQLKPSILVNNVGINVEFPTEFVDMSKNDIDRIITINVVTTNRMTAALLPDMLKCKRGLVFCLSSGGGAVLPAPLLAPYAGTKAYNDAFAVSLSGEVKNCGVFVHSLTPFFVESAMAKMRRSFTVPSADLFADSALRLAGSSPRLQPYWVHYILALGLTALPLSAQVSYIANSHRSIRNRALRKKEKLAKQN